MTSFRTFTPVSAECVRREHLSAQNLRQNQVQALIQTRIAPKWVCLYLLDLLLQLRVPSQSSSLPLPTALPVPGQSEGLMTSELQDSTRYTVALRVCYSWSTGEQQTIS